jgi:uncharacterized membrane protein SirB2
MVVIRLIWRTFAPKSKAYRMEIVPDMDCTIMVIKGIAYIFIKAGFFTVANTMTTS